MPDQIIRGAEYEAFPRHDSQGGSVEMQQVLDMEQFMGEVDAVQHQLRELRTHTNTAHSLYRASPTASGTDSIAATAATQRTTELSNAVRNSIFALNDINRQSPRGDPGFEARKKHIQGLQAGLRRALEDVFKVEKEAREQQRRALERQYRLVKPDATPEQMDEALAGSIQGRQIFAVALTETREVGARTAYTEAQYRNTELREIERSMSEVAQLMNDMGTLVIDQDYGISDVERNAVAAEGDTRAAREQTTRARKFAQSARKMRWWAFGVFLIAAIILAAVLGTTLSK